MTLTEQEFHIQKLEHECLRLAQGVSHEQIERELELMCDEFESNYQDPEPEQPIFNNVTYLRTRVFFVLWAVTVVLLGWPIGFAAMICAGVAWLFPRGREIQQDTIDLDVWR